MSSWAGETKGWIGGRNGSIKKDLPCAQKCKTVVLYIVRCPECGSRDHRVYSTDLPIRYHKCVNGHLFKSIEKECAVEN